MNPSLQFVKHGDPAKVLQLAQVPLEAGPAPGFVRVEIKARAVNPADLLFVEGVYGKEVGDQIKLGKAQTGGSECSGVVSAVGEGVTNVAVGQRVYAGTGFPATRAWALHCDARAAAVVPLPPQVSFESGAQLLVNPMTAIGFLETMKADGLAAGDAFCLTAANSALCKMVLQLHALRGYNFRPICIVRSSSVRAELLALGAHTVIALDETADVEGAVRAAAPHGLKATFDALGGGAVVTALLKCLADKARHYVYGILVREALVVPTGDMLFRQTGLSGWYLGFFLGSKPPAVVGGYFGEILSHLASGKLVFSAKTFDFVTQWQDAVAYTIDGSKHGKTVMITK